MQKGATALCVFGALTALATTAAAGTATSTIVAPWPIDQGLADAERALVAGEAARALELTEQSSGLLDDYRALVRARALAALGKRDRAHAALEAVKAPTTACAAGPAEDHPLWVDVVRERARFLADAEPIAAAELLGTLRATPELLTEMLDLYRRTGERGQAERLEARLLTDHPESPEARAIAKKLGAAGVAKRLGSIDQRVARVRSLLEAHQNADARDEAEALSKALPKESELACELHFVIGKAERKLRAYGRSIEALDRARARCLADGDADTALRAALLEVQVRAIRGHAKEAKQLVDWMKKAHPTHSFVDDAVAFLATIHEGAGRVKDAKLAWTEVADQIPGADQAPEASWRLAYLAMQVKDQAETARRLEQLLARPDLPWADRGRARYWLARTLEATEPAKSAALDRETVLELSFYGWLTLDHLERTDAKRASELKSMLTELAKAEPPPVALPASITGAPEVERAKRLHALGARAYAEGELERLACRERSDEEILALALTFDAIDAHPRAQALLRGRHATMLKTPITPEGLRPWRAAYSRPFEELVVKAATESKVEPLFLLALVREESTFDPEIVSWAGAVGLAQLMPGTAIQAHAALRLGRLDLDRLTDPALNLRLGARVLGEGLSDFGKLEPLALVAYNGGPGVAKKLVGGSAKDFDRWVEDIRIKETRNYVKRVMGTWGIYRWLYDRERPYVDLPDRIGGS
ncbi:lytic transglycosylase domain-containing protein [Myxococcota bacterium]|nr:lytic transglycosylase domain-containing protein [Myxococcota bacterium]